ncbi:ankyrin repeat domain-containing protein [Legionella gresilensis]|uniref:ankyrin repeat domain-containing protein n=1 Tax=Legionella gresilensis TaxID=91823 RepID=UPI0013EF9D5B|nr:ankyrin repeat domain-containing protein [Legionella gresilensis]
MKLNDEIISAIEEKNVDALRDYITTTENDINYLYDNYSFYYDYVSLLHMAVYNSAYSYSVEIIKLLLDHGANVNCLSRFHDKSPLHYAADVGNVTVVDLLIQHGADINLQDDNGKVPLHYALGKPDCMELLLKKGAQTHLNDANGDTPVNYAYMMQLADEVKLLKEYGAELSVTKALLLHSFKELSEHDFITTIASWIANKQLDINTMSLNVDGNDYFLLHLAVHSNKNELVKFLVENGAQVDLKIGDEQYSPLHIAALNNNTTAAELLLEYKANPNIAAKDGETPLHCASANEFLDIMTMLLNKGANVNTQDEDQDTPSHYAIERKKEKAVDLLIAHNADANIRNSKGLTPLHKFLAIEGMQFTPEEIGLTSFYDKKMAKMLKAIDGPDHILSKKTNIAQTLITKGNAKLDMIIHDEDSDSYLNIYEYAKAQKVPYEILDFIKEAWERFQQAQAVALMFNHIFSSSNSMQLNDKQVIDQLNSRCDFLQTQIQQLKNKNVELEDEVMELKAKLLSLGIVDNDKPQNSSVSQYKGSLFNLNATLKSDESSTELTDKNSTQFLN